LLHHNPREFGIVRARWRLQDVGRALAWLNGYSNAGIYKVLKRLGFSRKRALNFIRSPDPAYREKWQAILRAYREAVCHPDQVVILFLDELTYYRQPSHAPAYHVRGKTQPLAIEVAGYNTKTRLVAVLNAITGQVTYLQRSKIGIEALVAFYALVRASYPSAEKIYLVQDNWPVHTLPEPMQAMQDQRLTPLFLPTYASWLNPIEKLWRWLKQEVLHLHRLAHCLNDLRQQVLDFLDQFKTGSDTLLYYVGLL
jgi:transposase